MVHLVLITQMRTCKKFFTVQNLFASSKNSLIPHYFTGWKNISIIALFTGDFLQCQRQTSKRKVVCQVEMQELTLGDTTPLFLWNCINFHPVKGKIDKSTIRIWSLHEKSQNHVSPVKNLVWNLNLNLLHIMRGNRKGVSLFPVPVSSLYFVLCHILLWTKSFVLHKCVMQETILLTPIYKVCIMHCKVSLHPEEMIF